MEEPTGEITKYRQELGAPGQVKPTTTPVTESDTLEDRHKAAAGKPSDEYLLSLPSGIPLERKFQKRRDELLKASTHIDTGGYHRITEPRTHIPTTSENTPHLGSSSKLIPGAPTGKG